MASTFKNAIAAGLGTSLTTVYTAPGATTTTIIGLSVANVLGTGFSTAADVRLVKSGGGSSAYIVKNADIPVGGSMVVVGGDQKLVLQTGDYIQVRASEAVSVDVIISVLELT
mgnify:CR=1 FL=1